MKLSCSRFGLKFSDRFLQGKRRGNRHRDPGKKLGKEEADTGVM